jgi:hypothetical protein
MVEDAKHTARSAGTQALTAQDKKTEIERMETVDILGWVDPLHDRLGIEPRRKRQLDQDSVHRIVSVELINKTRNLSLTCRCRKFVMDGDHADLFGIPTLASDVCV